VDVNDNRRFDDRDWLSEFPDEQSLLLDPPMMISPHRVAAKPAAQRQAPAHSPAGLVLHWLIHRKA